MKEKGSPVVTAGYRGASRGGVELRGTGTVMTVVLPGLLGLH